MKIHFTFIGAMILAGEISAAPTQIENYGNIPLAFTINKGQHNSSISYTAHGSGCEMAFSPTGTTFLLSRETTASVAKRAAKIAGDPKQDQPEYESFALKLAFLRANSNPEIQGEDRLPWNNNYFIGNDPSKWQTDVPNYKKIRFKEVYKGIDLVYYGNQKRVKYDFIVKPGEDPEQILLKYDGGLLKVNEKGELVVKTPLGEIIEEKPYCYQKINGKEIKIPIKYEVVEGGTYRFSVGEYDKTHNLVIDPEIVYSTYLGGIGTDVINGLAADDDGYAYVTGTCGQRFPVTTAAYGTTFYGIFISKINPTGTALVYSTYVGGTEGFNYSLDIKIDKSRNAYITGWTQSSDFPITSNAYDKQIAHNEAFVSKFNADGNELIYSTFIGGTGSDLAYSIAIDSQECAYITGETLSSDFPITPSAYRKTRNTTTMEGFLTKLNRDGSSLIYSTFLGTTGYAQDFSVIVDDFGNATVAGETEFADFPVTPGSYQHFRGGVWDIFLTKLDADGSKAIYSALFGGGNKDYATGIKMDTSGNTYICGYTESLDFPTTPGAFQEKVISGRRNGFVSKISSDGSSLIYSTLLGVTSIGEGNRDSFIRDIVINQKGNVFVTGFADDGLPITNNAFYNIVSGRGTFLAEFSLDGSNLEFSSYWASGHGATDGNKIALDKNGNAYIAGVTNSGDFPVSSGAIQDTLSYEKNVPPLSDAFISKFHFPDSILKVESTSPSPSEFRINSIYPNPFNPSTTIEFYLHNEDKVKLMVYSSNGQRIFDIQLGKLSKGIHSLQWDGNDNFNTKVSSGVYFIHLTCGKYSDSRKVLLMK